MELHQATDGGAGGRTSDHESGHPDSDQDAHSAAARSPDQTIRSPTSPTAHPKGHDHGHRDTVMEDHFGTGPPKCKRDEGTLAPTESLGSLATSAWQDAPSQYTSNAPGSTHWQDVGTTLKTFADPPLRTLQNPAAACYMNSAATGLAWSALKADGLKEDQWSNLAPWGN